LISRAYKYNPISNSFETIDNSTSFLPQLIWHISSKCNLNCGYCFAKKDNKRFDINNLEVYLAIFHELGVQKIDISGGEPLLFNKLPLLISELKTSNLYLTITTSSYGYQILKRWLLSNSELFSRVIVSIDGYDERSHDFLRGRIGSYESAYELIKKLPHNNLRINTVLTSLYKDPEKAMKLVDSINDLSVNEWCLIQPSTVNKKKSFDKVSISVHEFNKIKDFIIQYSKSQNFEMKIIFRYAQNYSGYWILYADGKLVKHFEKPIDKEICIDFTKKNIEMIKRVIKGNSIWLPTNK
jgi:MoaA/NifB/PqqE/SkfB family radical SAM enzyme